jgi:transcriptional regulator with XRE-family HTH domain
MATLGIYLRQLRQTRKLSVRALARQAGISHTALSSWEQGKHQPYLPELEAVLEALGATRAQREEVLHRIDAPRAIQKVREEVAAQNALYALTVEPLHGGDLLRAMRRRAGLTLEEVAHQMEVQASTLSRWERGITWPDIGSLHSLCRLLKAGEEEIVVLTCGPTIGTHRYRFDEAREVALKVLAHTTRGAYGLDWLLAVNALWSYASQQKEAQVLLACLYGDQARHLVEGRRFEEAQPWAERAMLLRETVEVTGPVWQQQGHSGWQGAILAEAYIPAFRERSPSPRKGLTALQEGLHFSLYPEYKAWYHSEMARLLLMVGQREAAISVGASALQVAEEHGEPYNIYYRRAYQSRLLAKVGRAGEAEAMFPTYPEPSHHPSIQMREQVWRAEQLLERGDFSRAEDTLFAVYERTPPSSLTRWEADQVRQRLSQR